MAETSFIKEFSKSHRFYWFIYGFLDGFIYSWFSLMEDFEKSSHYLFLNSGEN